MIHLENIALFFQKSEIGFGSISFDNITVVSMGPHYFPLGEESLFGIYRRGGDLSDIAVAENKVSGWSRALAGDMWVRLVAEKKGEKIYLKTSFENREKGELVAFAFFVKAKEVEIGNKRIASGSLNRFQGSSAPINLFDEKGCVRLQVNERGPLQIIPLAGGEHFWGANFLIAFEISDDQSQKVFDFEKILFYDDK